MTAVDRLRLHAGGGGGDADRLLGADPARVRARRRLPARTPARREGPGPDPADPGRRPHGARGPADGHARRPGAEPDHARQRAGQGHRGLLLPRHRRRTLRRRRRALPASPPRRSRRRRCAPCSARPTSTCCCRRASSSTRRSSTSSTSTPHPWGIKVTTVEIKDVEIPVAMQRAMALGAAGRARAAREDHPRRGRVPGLAAAARRRRRHLRQPGGAAAALHADADRDRGDAELDGRVPAAARHGQAVRRRECGARPRGGRTPLTVAATNGGG